MKLNIDDLSEKELLALNHRIVERLKFLDSMHAHAEMMEFNIGEKVSFHPSGKDIQIGVLVKYNKKTVSVVTEEGRRWNVPPHLLSKVKDERIVQQHKRRVIELKKRP
ncbi:MAG: hypothetical protein KAW01_04150 [Deltaproteobacteria bacterium]|nr:hypothetical protein [Deltaproteobacteria bacterium]